MTLIVSVVFVYFPILLIPFLFLLPTMIITLLKKNIHAFFTLPTTTTKTGDYKLQLHHHHHHPISSSGLGLISVARDADRPPNVVESAMLKPSPPASPSASAKRNIGFIDDIGGEVDGLMSCTESLGFESSDERRVDNRIEEEINRKDHNDENGNIDDSNYKVNDDWIRRRRESWRKVRSFPPPLTSLNSNGEPSFFLRPVRKDGRLELTEVRIHRQEILHASRHDGRLTLHLIPDDSILEEDDDEEAEEEEEEEEEVEQEEEEKEVAQEEEEEEEAQEQVEEEVVMVDEEEEEEEEEEDDIGYEKEVEERVGEWRLGNDYEGGLRRCHEMVNHHHHRHHHHGVQFHGGHHLRMCGISIV